MIRVNDTLRVLGSIDRFGVRIPTTTWVIVALDRIDGSGMSAVVAIGNHYGRFYGRFVWLTGRIDIVGRPGHQPEAMRASGAALWSTEAAALSDHADRISGDVW